jgi:diguanylate cyclase (GGDEF)-like protein
VLPFAAFAAVAFGAAFLERGETNWNLVAGAGIGTAIAVGVATALPWRRLTEPAFLALAVVADLLIALLRHADGGSGSGYGALAILPVAWVGLTLGRRSVVAITASTTLLFALPILLIGGTTYPASGWRGVALWTVSALIIGGIANHIVTAQRQATERADTRALELTRLVETQSAIASSSFDLEEVMSIVVEEARTLTGASAAVVELPDGDELVYRAVAGTAADYQGTRSKRADSLSGRALATGETLVCYDSEEDPRVDREHCRQMGVRSLIVVPLVHGAEARGVLKVYGPTPEAFTEEHVRVLSALANIVGGALVRAELLERLRGQAVTDDLTGLLNRRAWYDELEHALVRSRRSGRPVSVVLLDLDRFKQINDTHGHVFGDRLLRTVSACWNDVLRDVDTLGRIGGDEFAVIVEDSDYDETIAVVARLEAAMPDYHEVSAGFATWDGDEDVASLINRADRRMYDRKPAVELSGALAEAR